MLSRIHSAYNDSKILDNVAVRDTGRKSLLRSSTGLVLGGLVLGTYWYNISNVPLQEY